MVILPKPFQRLEKQVDGFSKAWKLPTRHHGERRRLSYRVV
jgi:hypothetical protein